MGFIKDTKKLWANPGGRYVMLGVTLFVIGVSILGTEALLVVWGVSFTVLGVMKMIEADLEAQLATRKEQLAKVKRDTDEIVAGWRATAEAAADLRDEAGL